jgi:hypothetical protein
MAEQEGEFNLKKLFIPLTDKKAIWWIICIGFLVYANMLFNGFVWDDVSYLISNPDLHRFNLFHLLGSNIYNSIGFYRPVAAIYFGFLYLLFKDNPFFYHFLQLLIHIANVSLLFYFLSKFVNKKISFFLSLIFLLHPIQAESVSWISATVIPLSFLFGMIALLISLKGKLKAKHFILIFIFLFLSILTRETGVLFLFLIVSFRLIFKKTESLLYLVGSGTSAIIAFLILRMFMTGSYSENIAVYPITRLTFFERMVNIPSIFFYYIKTLFYPVKLSIDQLWFVKQINFWTFYFPFIVDFLFVLIICVFGFYIFKKDKKLFPSIIFFFTWFLVGMSAHLQILPLDMIVSERWFYFPMVGILGVAAIFLQSLKFRRNNLTLVYILTLCLLIILSVRTIIRNTDWSDPLNLYTHDVKISDNYDLENAIGSEFINKKRFKEALPHLEKSISLYPSIS